MSITASSSELAWTTFPGDTDFSSELYDSSFGGLKADSAASADEEALYVHYNDETYYRGIAAATPVNVALSHSRRASVCAIPLMPTPALSSSSSGVFAFTDPSVSPLSEAVSTPNDGQHLANGGSWYPAEQTTSTQGCSPSQLSPSFVPQPIPRPINYSSPPHQQTPEEMSPRRLSLAARRRRPSVQPIMTANGPSSSAIGLGMTRRGSDAPASVEDVHHFISKVKVMMPEEVTMPPTPTTPQRYSGSEIVLDRYEFSTYNNNSGSSYRHAASPTRPYHGTDSYSSPPSSARSVPSGLAMPSSPPYYANPPHSAVGYGFSYTIPSSYPEYTHFAYSAPVRPRSAPASPELASEGFAYYPHAHDEAHGQDLRRRQSAIDMVPRGYYNGGMPAYADAPYQPYTAQAPHHVRRPSYPYSYSAPAGPIFPTPGSSSFGPHPVTPAVSPNKVPAPARRPSASARKPKKPSPGAPMFVNYTSNDANKLLTGVAPSGSSKRKRDDDDSKTESSHKRRASETLDKALVVVSIA